MSPCCIAVNRISKLRHWKASADTSPVASLVNTPVAQIFLWTATVCSLDQLDKWSLCPKAASVRDLCLWPCSQGAAQAEWSNLGISKDNFRTHPRAPMWKIKSNLRNSDYSTYRLQSTVRFAWLAGQRKLDKATPSWLQGSCPFKVTSFASGHNSIVPPRCRKPAPSLLGTRQFADIYWSLLVQNHNTLFNLCAYIIWLIWL